MKWVGIDGNEANVSQRVGSNVYAFELLWALHEQMGVKPEFAVRVYLSAAVLDDMPPQNEHWQYHVIGPAKAWTQWRLPLELFFGPKLDLFFSPGHYTPRWSPVPVIPSIMDLAFLFFPDQFKARDAWQLTNLTRDSVKNAHHLVAISECTKKDIVKAYGYPSAKITVIYPASAPQERLSDKDWKKVTAKWPLPQNYIAFVGTLQPRKNIVRLVEAFELIAQKDGDVQLVLAGKVGWLGEPIQERIESSAYRDRILQLGFVSDEEKTAVIQGARATVLVGLYEGFGIPPLESILLGTPPVVSQTSSLPEVVGPHCITVDPYSAESIATGVQEVLGWTDAQREKHVQKLQKYAEKFGWAKSGQQLYDLLRSRLQG